MIIAIMTNVRLPHVFLQGLPESGGDERRNATLITEQATAEGIGVAGTPSGAENKRGHLKAASSYNVVSNDLWFY